MTTFHDAKLRIMRNTATTHGYESIIAFHTLAVMIDDEWVMFENMTMLRAALLFAAHKD